MTDEKTSQNFHMFAIGGSFWVENFRYKRVSGNGTKSRQTNNIHKINGANKTGNETND